MKSRRWSLISAEPFPFIRLFDSLRSPKSSMSYWEKYTSMLFHTFLKKVSSSWDLFCSGPTLNLPTLISARPFYVQLTETVRWPRLGHRSFVCFIKGQNISADTCLMHISAYWATMSQIFTLISSNTNQNYNLIMRGMRGWWEVSENCA